MNNNSVPEADGINLLRVGESGPAAGYLNSGGKPRPIRKKGFYRALRRKELWVFAALIIRSVDKAHIKLTDDFAKVIYSPYVSTNEMIITWPWEAQDE